MEIKTTVELQGNFFKPIAPHLLEGFVQKGIEDLVQIGEGFLMDRLKPQSGGGVYLNTPPSQGGSTGNYRRNISTSVKTLSARIDDGGVIYGPWLEGITSRNGSRPRFPGYSSFRKASQKMEKDRDGVFRKTLNEYVRKMNR